ncbi:MAG: hypothetical protein RL653_3180 [Pseudomonadota bacterium]
MRPSRLLAVPVLLAFAACGNQEPTAPDPYVPVQTEWDDVGTAPRCNPDDRGQNCLEPQDNTVRMDDEFKLNFESADFDDTTGVLTLQLKPGASLDSRIKEGAFLYRGRRDRKPLLHKVDGLRREGQVVTLKLSRAKARDAFKRGRIRVRMPLSELNQSQQPLGQDGLPLQVARQPLGVSVGPEDCSGVVFDKSFATVTAVGSAKLELEKCKFLLSAWVDMVLEWDTLLVNVDKLEVVVGGSAEASLHTKLTLDLSAKYGEGKRIWEGPEIPFSVGGLVLTVNPSLFAGYDLSAKANLTSTQGFDLTQSMEVGFGYSDRLGWYSVDERTSTFSKYGPTVNFTGNITATAWVEPRLDLKAFGFVGGSVALKGFAEASVTGTATASAGTYSGSICTDLDLGLTPKVGAVAELAGISLFAEYVELATFETKIVDNACVAYTGPVPSDCDVDSACCTDGQCPAHPDPDVTVQCEKGSATSGGKFTYSCVQYFPEGWCVPGDSCDDGWDVSQDACVDNRCEHVVPSVDEIIAAGVQDSPPVEVCMAPSCCYTNTDCADGNRATPDRCIKTGTLLGPNVKGTCKNQ